MNTIETIEVTPWNVPMRSPYRSAQRLTTLARNVLVTIRLSDGTLGYGESAPATYVTGETPETVRECVQQAIPSLIGTADIASLLTALAKCSDLTPGARCALETAAIDAFSRATGTAFAAFLRPILFDGAAPFPLLASAVTDLSLPILPPDEARQRAAAAAAQGFQTFKIKVGSADTEEDEARVRAVADAAPLAGIRIDGNQGFRPEEAIDFVARLTDLLPRLQLFEQPTKAGDDRAIQQVQKAIPIPVFADESVHHAEDARRLIEDGCCRGVVLKIAKSALLETAQIAQATADAGGVCLFGCMMETRIGVGAALQLALALGAPVVPLLDLDGHLLVDDRALVSGGLSQQGDRLTVDLQAPGLGLQAIPEAKES